MQMPAYPAGVPNPLTRHYHPYPTRFHGGNSVRPVFTLPFAYNPQIVNLPSGVHGLGADYDVSQGIFRPGGYGGGVFDGNLAGLGADTANVTYLKTKLAEVQQAITAAAASGNSAAVPALIKTAQEIEAQIKQASAPSATGPAPITSTSIPTVSPEASAQASMVSSGGDNKWLAFVVGGGLAIGVLVYLKKRKKI